mmetsp:Transcript_14881/g.27064  ORF Transcript_14881/g.27064 Transcript_14881/m.27064 type:complete len:80 (+) Transcript_14881:618-857(+)
MFFDVSSSALFNYWNAGTATSTSNLKKDPIFPRIITYIKCSAMLKILQYTGKGFGQIPPRFVKVPCRMMGVECIPEFGL